MLFMELNVGFGNLRISFPFARAPICPEGSEPIDNIQMRGVRGSDSSQVVSKFNICPSPYSGPSESRITSSG